ncbi:hypothetical protein [Paraburkholderia saeva]|uniref:hypothetical protein n=1 Tax=Paraburkholderia saeva TaxID=2777537 RepID=UPI001D530ED6|nr:hypothetical protein [Paraburkholderia saeva]CAG4895511.1 hypothetical protein R52603_02000 [Paraburkholderia saeva]
MQFVEADLFAIDADARPSTDYGDLILRARGLEKLRHQNFTEFLDSRLTRIALSTQRAWAEQLANQVEGQPITWPSVEPFTPLGDLTTGEDFRSLSISLSSLVVRLAKMDVKPGPNLAGSYFTAAGGAFRITNPDATITVGGKIAAEDSAAIIEINEKQLLSLNQIESDVSETLYTTRQAALLQKINLVQQRIREIEALPQNNGASFNELVASIQKNAPAIRDFVAAVYSENYIAAADRFPAAMAAVNDIYGTAYGEISSGDRPGLDEMKRAVRALEAAVISLNDTYKEEKNDLMIARYTLAANELAARHRLATRLDARLSVGEDLIKHSFAAYFIDPLRSKDALVENLRQSGVFLSGCTDCSPMLSLPPLSNQCQLDPDGKKNYLACVKFPASRSYQIAETKVSRFAFPAWIVAPSSRRTVLPTFNAPLSITKKKSLIEGTSAR